MDTETTRINVYPDDHLDPPVAHGFVGIVVILWLGCLLGCMKRQFQALRTAAKEDVRVDELAPLQVGNQWISGVIQFAEGEQTAVEVYLHQHLQKEDNPEDRAGITWRDSHRSAHTRPFYVRRGDGEGIRVEPGANVLLVDEFDCMISQGEHDRVFVARVSEGEKVFVEGVLSRDRDVERNNDTYRGSRGWIMRPPPEKPMQVSAEPLGQRYRLRAKAFRDAMWGVFIGGVIMHASFATYYARTIASETTTARVANKDSHPAGVGPDSPTTYQVEFSVPSREGVSFSRELDAEDWGSIRSGDTVDFRHVPSWPWASNPGRQSSIHLGAWFLGLFGALLGSAFYAFAVYHRRWYENETLDFGLVERIEVPPS